MTARKPATRTPSPALDGLFRTAAYRVFDAEATLPLHLDQCDAAAAAMLARHGARSAVLLTAWNPRARACPLIENRRRQQDLCDWLEAHAYRWIEAEGAAPDRSWVEPSLLIFDLEPEASAALVARFAQCAWIELDAGGLATLRYAESFGDNPDPCISS